ncbi:hypothetical protein DJ013_13285 [Arcticibacterium luteifluviistationis]|uniref:Uncharacterized protein n=1 Tax=Arcticibacterium luteifluviistationis TaxID=1784714 RepID=A0A2Z4GCX7_9BACT|nr:hypothetical protein DJ013_13285 [Arcticibacterium luteifluviistationis]
MGYVIFLIKGTTTLSPCGDSAKGNYYWAILLEKSAVKERTESLAETLFKGKGTAKGLTEPLT